MIVPDQIRVLIVDDNGFALKTLEAGLRKLGFNRIVAAGGGGAGLGALMTAPFDIALIDWYMPEVSGAGMMEVVASVRQARGRLHPEAAQTDFVVVTAYASPDMVAAAWAAGVRDILVKPFTDRQLAQLMGRLMAGRGEPGADASRAAGR